MQHDGCLSSGVIAALLDSACGYATLSLSPPGRAVLAVEFKVSFLSPVNGEAFIARAVVERESGALATCAAEGFSAAGDEEELAAAMISLASSHFARTKPPRPRT